jgi:phage-related protein
MLAPVFRKAKIVGAHAHRFRHTRSTDIVARGGTMAEMADVLGISEPPAVNRSDRAAFGSFCLQCPKYDTFTHVRPIVFHPGARDAIRQFPKDVRNRLGRCLFQLQVGERLGMPHSQPMPSVAAGVSELRVRGEDGSYRVFYFTLSAQGVSVFHAFLKKTRKTPVREIELARKRLKELLDV